MFVALNSETGNRITSLAKESESPLQGWADVGAFLTQAAGLGWSWFAPLGLEPGRDSFPRPLAWAGRGSRCRGWCGHERQRRALARAQAIGLG